MARWTIAALGAVVLSACEVGYPPIGDDMADEAGSTTTDTSATESSSDTDETGTTGTTDTSTDTADTSVSNFEECDVWAQDCAQDEKCVPYDNNPFPIDWDATECVAVTGDRAPGQTCTYDAVAGTDDCDASAFCYDGVCLTMCTGSFGQEVCPADTTCRVYEIGELFGLCYPICDPLAPDCPPEQGCFAIDDTFACASPGPALAGEPCLDAYDLTVVCAEGTDCVTASVPGCSDTVPCCTAYCDLALGDTQCAEQPGTQCMPHGPSGVGMCIAG